MGGNYCCATCYKGYSTLPGLIRHCDQKGHIPYPPDHPLPTCGKCGMKFPSGEGALRNHDSMVHPPTEPTNEDTNSGASITAGPNSSQTQFSNTTPGPVLQTAHITHKQEHRMAAAPPFKFDFSMPKSSNQVSRYSCACCGLDFANHRSLHRHTNSSVHGDPQHSCEPCEMHFFNDISLQRHLASIVHSCALFRCSDCNLNFLNKRSLDKHVTSIIHASLTYHCTACNVTLTTREDFEAHVQSTTHLPPKYVCESCNAEYTTPLLFDRHLASKMHKRFADYPCDQCESSFSSFTVLESHKAGYHSNNLVDVSDIGNGTASPTYLADMEELARKDEVASGEDEGRVEDGGVLSGHCDSEKITQTATEIDAKEAGSKTETRKFSNLFFDSLLDMETGSSMDIAALGGPGGSTDDSSEDSFFSCMEGV